MFLDRSLDRRQVAEALRNAGARIEIHDDHFGPETADENWLREAGRRGWIVLTKDARNRYRPNELRAIKDARVIVVILSAGNVTGDQMASLFVRALGGIERHAANAEPPALFSFGRAGRVRLQRL